MDWWSGTIDDLAAERYEVVLDQYGNLEPGSKLLAKAD